MKQETSIETSFIKSFEEACEKQGMSSELPDFSAALVLGEDFVEGLKAHYKLVVINKALNEDWEPDWDNRNEYKYEPWFDMEKRTTAGSGFAFHGCVLVFTRSSVGSRLCFKSRELAKYAGTQFLALYKAYFVIQPKQG